MSISVNDVVHGSVQNPLPQKILLNGNEQVKLVSRAQILYGAAFRLGLFMVTSQRLVFVQDSDRQVLLNRLLRELVGVAEEKNVLIGESLRDVIKISYPNETFILDIEHTTPPGLNVEAIAESITRLREATFIRVNTSSRQDFSWLKDLLDKGGVMVTSVKCPACGSPVEIPKEGSFTKCNHCSQTLYVQDILKIIRQLRTD